MNPSGNNRAVRSMGVFLVILRPTLFLTALTVVLHHADWAPIKWLDGPFLAQVQKIAVGRNNTSSVQQDVEVVTIEIAPELFEGELRRSTPLDRNFLANLLIQVSKAEPKAIVVDLDLSPPARQLAADQASQESLDKALKDVAERTPVILMVPAADSKEGKQARERWMRQMCEPRKNQESKKMGPGISYGIVQSITQDGVALSFPKKRDACKQNQEAAGCGRNALYPGLAVVACSATEEWAGEAKRRCVGDAVIPVHRLLCAVPDQIDGISEESHGGLETINFASVSSSFLAFPLRSSSIDAVKLVLPGKVVFIGGGAYGQADMVVTPLTDSESSKWPGVEMHAAAYAALTSERGSLRVDSFKSAIVDLVCGFLYGAALHALLHRRKRDDPSGLPPFFREALLAILPLALAYFLYLIVAYLSVNWVANGVWMNPAIVLVGLLIHSYHQALHGATVGREHGASAAPSAKAVVRQFVWTDYPAGRPRSKGDIADRALFYFFTVGVYWGITISAVYILLLPSH